MAQAQAQYLANRLDAGSQYLANRLDAGSVRHTDSEQQLALQGLRWPARRPSVRAFVGAPSRAPLCAGCRAKEARYGFRPEGAEDESLNRPRTLCFDCFRIELDRRRRAAEQLARGWNAAQVGLPLEDTLNELSLRRRRAQIAARHALELS